MKAIFSPMHQQEAWQSRFMQWDQVLTLPSFLFLLLHPALQPWAVCTPGYHAVSLWGAWRHFASVEKAESGWLPGQHPCTLVWTVPLVARHLRVGTGCNSPLGFLVMHCVWFKKMLQNLLELSRDRYLSSGMFDRSNKSSSSANLWFYYVDFMTM